MSANPVDLVGGVFGRLTVEGMIYARGEKTRCDTRCACGKRVTVRADHLRTGRTRSCGCLVRRDDLLGTQVGRLVVLRRAENVDGGTLRHPKGFTAFVCGCGACGREVIVPTHKLAQRRALDCGCTRLLRDAPPAPAMTPVVDASPPVSRTSSANALRRFHDTQAPLGRVRVVSRSVVDVDDGPDCLSDADPYPQPGDIE